MTARHSPSAPSLRPIALIGAPTDVNSSFRRGPAAAPRHIRAALASEHGNAATECGLEIGREIELRDRGDLPLREEPADDARISDAIAQALAAGEAPLLLGGDHSVTAPAVRAVARAHRSLSILHFDAHPDLYELFEGNPRSHASPFARILEAGLARRLVQVGIRTANAHQRAQIERFGVEVVPMRGFRPERVPRLEGPVYVSVDLDGLDPAFAPGVSHPEPGGLAVRDVLDVLHALEDVEVVGADVVELNPSCDPQGITAIVAAKLVRELAALLARGAGS